MIAGCQPRPPALVLPVEQPDKTQPPKSATVPICRISGRQFFLVFDMIINTLVLMNFITVNAFYSQMNNILRLQRKRAVFWINALAGCRNKKAR
jgi:hypothetical protein